MHKNPYLMIFAVFALSFSLSACTAKQGAAPEAGPQRIKVVATIFPLYDLVKAVGGDKIDVSLALEPGASPHTFEATPGKIKEMNGAKAFFMIGAGLDFWAENIAKSLADVKVIDMDEYAALKPFQHEESGHEGEHDEEEVYEEDGDGHENGEEFEHGHGEFDPHYWLDPAIARSMLPHIAEELAGLDPANSEYYQQAAADYAAEIRMQEPLWRQKLGQLENRKIVVFHDAWGYFADHFGLTIVASFEPFPGKSPSPSYLAGLQEEVEEHNIKILFVEPQLSAEALRTLADDLGVKVDVLDPLGGVPGRDNYIGLIDYNVNTIYEAHKQ